MRNLPEYVYINSTTSVVRVGIGSHKVEHGPHQVMTLLIALIFVPLLPPRPIQVDIIILIYQPLSMLETSSLVWPGIEL